MPGSPFLLIAMALGSLGAQGTSLEAQLRAENLSSLARDARTKGIPARGAFVFYRPELACARCHEGEHRVGPDLTQWPTKPTDEQLVTALLDPSDSIREGFATVTVATVDGRTLSGLVISETPESLVLRDPAQPDQPITLAKTDIDERRDGGASLMPAGLVNMLATRQEFLNLFAYLRAISDGGPDRARALQPDPALLAPAVPDYEKVLDHRTLISSLDDAAFQRGEAIYARVCANCHGTLDRIGTMPTSLRFASGRFKNGADPYRMYRTLTEGFGQMPPQRWMVPRQKYDVIHYIREAFLKSKNQEQYISTDENYFASIPKGHSLGPDPAAGDPWSSMDYGPYLMLSLEAEPPPGAPAAPGGQPSPYLALKGIAIRLDDGPGGVAQGRRFALYDHDTMARIAIWESPDQGGRFIDWKSVLFDGRHEVHPRTMGTTLLATPNQPAWADPATSSFDDPRPRARDGRPYGPLPRAWLRYRGLLPRAGGVVLSYDVGGVPVLELAGTRTHEALPDLLADARQFEVGPSDRELLMRVGPAGLACAVVAADSPRPTLFEADGETRLRIPARAVPTRFLLLSAPGPKGPIDDLARRTPPPGPIDTGGVAPRLWDQPLFAPIVPGDDDGPFAVDVLSHPATNPWASRMRLSGLDFFPGGQRAAVSTWDGDVWIVDGVDQRSGSLAWHRFATGLFQPLGLRIVDDTIYVTCRDQIARLRDTNGDLAADAIEAFNADHQVTEHFHEFAMDLQTDAAGNFYYAKAARHALPALVPHHGTLLRVSPSGDRTDILATGFRAPNGVWLEPDGSFFVSDQEGHWVPKNRINRVVPGGFYGNAWAYTDLADTSDSAVALPLCWITNAFDRSPSEQLRVPAGSWGPLGGHMISLSYGYGLIFGVLSETLADGTRQGGLARLPIPQVPTGLVRGRFHPVDGQLYACGLFGWASNQEQPGGLYRVRHTGRPIQALIGLEARPGRLVLTFTDPIEPASVTPDHFQLKAWNLTRSQNYGSPHVGEHPLPVQSATLSPNGKTITLTIPTLTPAQGLETRYTLRSPKGHPVEGVVHHTIHRLGESKRPEQ